MKSLSLRMKTLKLTATFVIASFGCVYAAAPDFTLAKKLDPEYDKVYPYYVEVAAVSRVRPLNGKEGGGWGHALMYIKGACIDTQAEFPKLRLCGAQDGDIHSPETGAGVSVDKMFKSVNWIAVPGKNLFYHGDLRAPERLTQDFFEKTVSRALSLNLFRGVKFYEIYLMSKPPAMSDQEFIARKTAATDYAIKFGRTSLIARRPVTREMVSRMISYLNSRNADVFSGKTEFNWSAYYDNCAHTVHNALAAAGIGKTKSINQWRVKQFFNRAIPANEFSDFAFQNKDIPGSLLKIIPAYEPNDLYGTDFKLFVLEGPVRKPITRKVRKMFADPRHTDLEANLKSARREL